MEHQLTTTIAVELATEQTRQLPTIAACTTPRSVACARMYSKCIDSQDLRIGLAERAVFGALSCFSSRLACGVGERICRLGGLSGHRELDARHTRRWDDALRVISRIPNNSLLPPPYALESRKMRQMRWISVGVMAACVVTCCTLLDAQECGCDAHGWRNGPMASGPCTACQNSAVWGQHAFVGKAKFHRLAAPPPTGVVVSSYPVATPAAFAMTTSMAYPAPALALAPQAPLSAPVVTSAMPIGVAAAPVIYGAAPLAVPSASVNAYVLGNAPIVANSPAGSVVNAPPSLSTSDIANLTTMLDALRASRAAAAPTCASSSRNAARSSAPAAPQPPPDTTLEDRVRTIENNVAELARAVERLTRIQEQQFKLSE